MGILHGKKESSDKKTILLRADMDALPIEEDNDLEFKSRNKGVMHACGHDVHTSNLLGVANILSKLKDDFAGTAKFIFQPAEERGGGAREVIKDGVLEDPKVDMAMAMHIVTDKEGTITAGEKYVSANSDGFILRVYGEKAHSSMPQRGVDAINIAAQIIVGLNSIGTKSLDPYEVATFSIGKITGGTASNIVADYVEMEAIVRTITDESKETIFKRVEEISTNIAKSYGGSCEMEIIEGYPSIYNDPDLSRKLISTFEENYYDLTEGMDIEDDGRRNEVNDPVLALTAEDFGFYSRRVPSVYYQVGTGGQGHLHNAKFTVNEDFIKFCTRCMSFAAIDFLNN